MERLKEECGVFGIFNNKEVDKNQLSYMSSKS